MYQLSEFCHIGYIPRKRVVGISKLARLVDLFGKDFRLRNYDCTDCNTIDKVLQPKGVAVVIDANPNEYEHKRCS